VSGGSGVTPEQFSENITRTIRRYLEGKYKPGVGGDAYAKPALEALAVLEGQVREYDAEASRAVLARREAEGRLAEATEALRQKDEALSWALDVLELALKRIDSVDDLSDEHMRIRAGLAKARRALALRAEPANGEPSDEVLPQTAETARPLPARAEPAKEEA